MGRRISALQGRLPIVNKILFLVASKGQPQEAKALQEMFDLLPQDYDLLFILDANNSMRNAYDEADVSYIMDKNPTGNLSDQLPKYADSFADNYERIFAITQI
jgi:predicted oxidoreductase (fatty acid repression mutant protein)